ncbi:MAG: hypothetical protein K8H88_24050 [Sandaracinaceae bacterium]|nr:hypothetical protein [Sandaracinaceae bacterium]
MQAWTARLAERTRGLSDELLVLVLDAFTEGQRQGARRVRDELRASLERRRHELEARYESLTPEDVEVMRQALGDGEGKDAAVVTARFGSAAELLIDVDRELDRLAVDPPPSRAG